MPSCNFIFETDNRFFKLTANSPPPSPGSSPPSSPPQSPSPVPGDDSDTARTVIIIVIPIVSVMILITSICTFLRTRKPREKVESETVDEISKAESLQFDFYTIRVATDNFSDANKLAQGGFGAVCMGRLPDGQEVAQVLAKT